VEVGWRVVSVEHPNHYPQEAADLGDAIILPHGLVQAADNRFAPTPRPE
jgi:hypothetical protein